VNFQRWQASENFEQDSFVIQAPLINSRVTPSENLQHVERTQDISDALPRSLNSTFRAYFRGKVILLETQSPNASDSCEAN